MNTHCGIKTNEKIVALSFDDGPTVASEKIMNILQKKKVHAAFFCIGSKVKESPEIVKKMDLNGHLIGSHTQNHKAYFGILPRKKTRVEIEDGVNSIKKVLGKKPKLFRPPFGVTNPAIAWATRFLNLIPVGWNIRSLDTVIKNKDTLKKRIQKKLKPGSIILFHEHAMSTQLALEETIDYIEQEGYKIIRLDQLLNIKAYE